MHAETLKLVCQWLSTCLGNTVSSWQPWVIFTCCQLSLTLLSMIMVQNWEMSGTKSETRFDLSKRPRMWFLLHMVCQILRGKLLGFSSVSLLHSLPVSLSYTYIIILTRIVFLKSSLALFFFFDKSLPVLFGTDTCSPLPIFFFMTDDFTHSRQIPG